MELETTARIYVSTSGGEREIQLCLGDITTVRETVDVILVSAFPGDYAPLRTSVIGALKHKLGINVRNIANHHKKEDLRSSLSCWISKPLPRGPFRQLICLERTVGSDLQVQVDGVFRAMMAAFNNEMKTVITPLLSTNFQEALRSNMLEMMVQNAVSWMQMGLPLQCLQIVLFVNSKDRMSSDDHLTITKFNHLKKIVENQKATWMNKEIQVTSDVYIFYNASDDKDAKYIIKNFKKQKKSLKLLEVKDIDRTEKWKHDIFMLMLTCKRIVPLLSISFLKDINCLDQFNIALCCNRFVHDRHILAPFYLEQFDVPEFMSMVQWLNCRPRDERKMQQSVESLVDSMESDHGKECAQYDVFISYSHKNKDIVKHFVDTLKGKKPDLKVFLDSDQISTGVQWQMTLYNGLDSTKCTVAFLSSDYFKSRNCKEELAISLAKHRAKKKDLELIPVLIEQVDKEDLSVFDNFALCDFSSEEQRKADLENFVGVLLKCLAKDVVAYSALMEPLDIDGLFASQRENNFNLLYRIQDDQIMLQSPKKVVPCRDGQPWSLFLSYSLRDQIFAEILQKMKETSFPSCTIINQDIKSMEDTHDFLKAECFVVFWSKNYLKSEKQLEDLLLLLQKFKHAEKNSIYFLQTSHLPDFPSFSHLIPPHTNLQDDFWPQISMEHDLDENSLDLMESLPKDQNFALSDLWAMKKVACDLSWFSIHGSFPECSTSIVDNVQLLNTVTDALSWHKVKQTQSSAWGDEETAPEPEKPVLCKKPTNKPTNKPSIQTVVVEEADLRLPDVPVTSVEDTNHEGGGTQDAHVEERDDVQRKHEQPSKQSKVTDLRSNQKPRSTTCDIV